MSDRWMIKELPVDERPAERLRMVGTWGVSAAELLAIVLGTGDGLALAEELLMRFDGLEGLLRATVAELCEVMGIGEVRALQIKAALELGRRVMRARPEVRARVTSPGDAVNLLMPEMMFLEQEHLRLILLNTRNEVIGTPTVYVGSLNTSVVRIGEIFRAGIRANAAAMIVAHNHPSGDPSPSPEDVNVTRELVKAGNLMDIEVLDHVIIGRQRYTSMKERGLGFD